MKKKMFVCAFVAICLSIVAYGTIAYFTYEETAANVITSGTVKIDLQEWAISEESGEQVPFEDVTDVVPGTEVSKIIQIKNTGSQPAWVRIGLEKSILLAEGITGEVDISLISYDLNTEDWTEKEGYYYYNKALDPGETTEPLFTKVVFAKTMGNMYQESKAIIEVSAQATQVAHNGDTVFETMGWLKQSKED